jgi:predicted RNA-binding Zn-ribbon protein involved in translation (DUF1610 family)
MQAEIIECPNCHNDVKYNIEAGDLFGNHDGDGAEAEDDCFECPACGKGLRVTVQMSIAFDVSDVEVIEED